MSLAIEKTAVLAARKVNKKLEETGQIGHTEEKLIQGFIMNGYGEAGKMDEFAFVDTEIKGTLNLKLGETYVIRTYDRQNNIMLSYEGVCQEYVESDGTVHRYVGFIMYIESEEPADGDPKVLVEEHVYRGEASISAMDSYDCFSMGIYGYETTPISDKYLPGVCLPVVELETPGSLVEGSSVELTEDESKRLTEVTKAGMPFIVVCGAGVDLGEDSIRMDISAVCSVVNTNGITQAVMGLGAAMLMLSKQSDTLWTFDNSGTRGA